MLFTPALEGLRGLAFLLVFVAHASQFANASLWLSGKEGLFLFFVLSAYLLTKNLTVSFTTQTNKSLVLLNYVIRRILRIYPMYMISMFFLPAIILYRHPLTTIINHLLLTTGYEHLWTISVEIKYYILLPLVAFLLSALAQKGMRILISTVIIFLTGYGLLYEQIASTVAIHHLGNELSIWLYLPAFVIGSCASFWSLPQKNTIILKYKNGIILLLGLLLCLSLPLSYHVFVEKNAYTIFYYLLMVFYSIIWSTGIYLIATLGTTLHSLLENKILRTIGKVSFSAYLWHYSLFLWTDIIAEHGIILAAPIKIITVFALTLLFSAITYRFIEKPFLSIQLLPNHEKS
jgi:peptidoglycan/LPS O-acetylase OafA/YrhL